MFSTARAIALFRAATRTRAVTRLRIVAAASLFLFGLCVPARARAATDAQHVERLDGLRDSRTTACAELNAAYFAARDFPNPSSALDAALSTMFVYRQRHGCLVLTCPAGQKCSGPRKRLGLSDYFDTTRNDLLNCLKDVECRKTNEKRLRDTLLDTVVVIVRTYPENDPLVKRVLEGIGIGLAGESEVLRRCAELLEVSPTHDEGVLKILRTLASKLKAGTIKQEMVNELTNLLEQFGAAAKLDPETRKKLFSAIAKLLRTHDTQESAQNIVDLAEELGAGEQGERLLVLIRAARDLKVPKNREALAHAVRLILKNHPKLDQQVKSELEKSQKAGDLQAQLVALTRIMNGAELEELRRLREAAQIWQITFASERVLRVLAVSRAPKGCPDTADGAVCKSAEMLWAGFYDQLNDEAGHGADAVPIRADLTASAIVGATVQLLEQDMSSGGVKDGGGTPCDEAQYGSLCKGPYIGVYVLEVEARPGGRGGAVCGKAYYAVRGVDFNVQSAVQGLSPVCVDEHDPIDDKGRELATRVLHQSTLNKYFPKEHCRKCTETPRPPASWRQWVTLGTLIGGTVAAGAGVYVSNTEPDSAVGDRLWQGGLFLLSSSLVVHVWELASD
jgi:hypothetical protein